MSHPIVLQHLVVYNRATSTPHLVLMHSPAGFRHHRLGVLLNRRLSCRRWSVKLSIWSLLPGQQTNSATLLTALTCPGSITICNHPSERRILPYPNPWIDITNSQPNGGNHPYMNRRSTQDQMRVRPLCIPTHGSIYLQGRAAGTVRIVRKKSLI